MPTASSRLELVERLATILVQCVCSQICLFLDSNSRVDESFSSCHYLALLFLTASALFGKLRLTASRLESRRVAELVQVALETLRSHELAHHTDPVTVPHGYISSSHLRDLVLLDEHSGKARRRLWEKVERVVEGNANVRASIEEVNGDETRAWRWTGMITGPSPRKVQWGAGDSPVKDDSPAM